MNLTVAGDILLHQMHVSRSARDKYQFEDSLFAQHGDVIFSDYHAVRKFAQKMNDRRNLVEFPEKAVRASDINGIGLIHEVLHFILMTYRDQKSSDVFSDALTYLKENLSDESIRKGLRIFTDTFPPLRVYQGEEDPEKYLSDTTEETPHEEVMLEELILVWLANNNPAFSEYRELFDDTLLSKQSPYLSILEALDDFFNTQSTFGPEDQQLLDMLQVPANASPHSIAGQLEWIRTHWSSMLGSLFYRLLRGIDFIKEEQKARFTGAGPIRMYDFKGEVDYERFSEDLDWMPKVVLLAKNAYVWLDQLSKKYQREIDTLDKIPDEELDTLARWGITGLWLIGLWERSDASQRIKQMMGNPEAVASAYSLYDYIIASDLGGEEAYEHLRRRARERGIRLSGDMVPNHVGIDGKWVNEHPDWFVQLNHSPYPSYSFNGPDLSKWDDVGIYLEDHYYERSDAAVVFKRVNHDTGETRYIYHGNDGTSMPWNDTAQLDYLNEEVREAVINTILHVASKFDIIRFDAAMTLAKKHYQRLWFPEPGTGGDIPSRAEHGMTKEEFDRVFPKEFWREVVDRVAEEEPDTLLLAEAFWLMEGYFVRTLGMHRVYNSAFMNMLKNEDNAKYRQTIKNVLEFNPEILKRFVNFMNNPDEDTAVAQFGKDDKYFGTCILMVTMPGLPMIGHGQIEGYTEKYGMEYKRAYWDETPDEHLVERHRREIFPLLQKRSLFAKVRNFVLYDFFTPEGHVNENVFAYSNRSGDGKGLVVYNNKFEDARGWIRSSVAHIDPKTGSDQLVQKSLGEGLQVRNEESYFTIFRDQITGLEFIRNSKRLYDQGLYVELGAFKYQVFLDFREVYDEDGQYRELADYLNGRGVPSIQEALKETILQPIHTAARSILNKKYFEDLATIADNGKSPERETVERIESGMQSFLEKIQKHTGAAGNAASIVEEIISLLGKTVELSTRLPSLAEKISQKNLSADIDVVLSNFEENPGQWHPLFAWVFLHRLGKLADTDDFPARSRTWLDELLLNKVLENLFGQLDFDGFDGKSVLLVQVLTSFQEWFSLSDSEQNQAYQIMEALLKDSDVRDYLGVNRYQDVLWFNGESFEELMYWLRVLAIIDFLEEEDKEVFAERNELVRTMERAKKASDYRVEALLDELKSVTGTV